MKAPDASLWIGFGTEGGKLYGCTSFDVAVKKVMGQMLTDRAVRQAAELLKDRGWSESTEDYGQDYSKPFTMEPGSFKTILESLNPQIEGALQELRARARIDPLIVAHTSDYFAADK